MDSNHNQNQKNQETKKPLNPFIRFTAVGFQMGATIFLGNLFGKWLDDRYALSFWESTITLLAVLVSIYLVISQVIKLSKEQNRDD